MSEVKTEFLETSADFKVESLPLSHVSVELGHLYMEDLAGGESAVRRTFAAAAPWVRTAQTPQAVGCDKKIRPGQHLLPHRRLLQPVLVPGRR